MNDLKTHADLNILPLSCYDLLIGMVWLEKLVILNCYYNKFSCLDDKFTINAVKAILRKVTIREILALQMKRSIHKLCNFFVVYVMDNKKKDNQLKIEDIQF